MNKLSDEQLTRVHKWVSADISLNLDSKSIDHFNEKLKNNNNISRKEKIEDLKSILQSRKEVLTGEGKQAEIDQRMISKVVHRKIVSAIATMGGMLTITKLDTLTDNINTKAPLLNEDEVKAFRESIKPKMDNLKKIMSEANVELAKAKEMLEADSKSQSSNQTIEKTKEAENYNKGFESTKDAKSQSSTKDTIKSGLFQLSKAAKTSVKNYTPVGIAAQAVAKIVPDQVKDSLKKVGMQAAQSAKNNMHLPKGKDKQKDKSNQI